MIKYIIFDLGGVIVESGTTLAYQKIGSLLNLTKEQIREYLAESSPTGGAYRKGEITKEEFWKKTLTGWGKKYDWTKLNDIWVSGYSIKDGMIPLLQKLKNNGYVLGILSNTVEDRFIYIDKQVHFSKYFQASVASFKDHLLKPDKRAFQLIMKGLNIKNPKETVYIDDKEIHANVAKRLGMHAIVCLNAQQLTSDLRTLGVKV
ncbi:HAD family phosphatase [Candidatus Gottesmanbacteria bacterium]|nr:HAD family phosphatase [Candidatus Gottesmanbacteria bacterium]